MGKKIGSLFVEFSATVDKFMAAMNKGEKGLVRMGRRWSSIGNQMSVGISLPLAAIGKYALTAAADFEASMNKVSALGDITGSDLDALKNQALELGKKTQFSAKQAADGMAELAAAGFNTQQIMAAMPGVLDLAAAAQVGVAEASGIAVTTMGAFHLSAEKSAEVADVLASASARGVLNIQDLAESLKYVGPVAYATGRSLEETAAAISLLSNAGIKGSQAGTALRMGIIRFIKPTKQAQEVISALNLQLTDGAGKIRPLVDIIGQLQQKHANLAQVTKLVGVEAATAWQALVDSGAPALDALTQAIDKDNGAAQRMAATLRQGLKGGFEQMMGSVETAAIALIEGFKPAVLAAMKEVEQFANKITDLGKWFATLSPAVQNFTVAVLAFVTIAGPLLAILGPIASGLSVMLGGVKLLIGAFLALLTPAGAVIAIIGALSVIAYEIYENWGGIKAFFVDLWTTIAEKSQLNFTLMREAWDQFWNDFQKGAEVIKNFAGQILQSIIDFVDKSIEYIDKLGTKIKDSLVGEFGRTVDQLKGLTNDVTGFFGDMYDKVVGHSYVPDMVDGIQHHVERLEGDALVNPVKKSAKQVAREFETLQKSVAKDIDGVMDAVDKASGVIDPLVGQIEELIKGKNRQGLEDLATGFVHGADSADRFKDALKAANENLKETAQAAKEASKELSGVFGEIAGAFGADKGTSDIIGGFLGSIFSGTSSGGGGGFLAEMLGKLVGGGDSTSGLGSIAESLGSSFGLDFGSAAGQDASQAIGQNMDGSLIFAEGGDAATMGATESMMGYATAVLDSVDALKKLGKSSKETAEGLSEVAGTAIGAYFGGPAGAQVGNKIGSVVGKLIGKMFGGTNAETQARKSIEKFLEDALAKVNIRIPDGVGGLKDLKNIIFGPSDRFDDGNWADQFKAMGSEAMTVFDGLGKGLTKVLGITEDVGGQIGFILAENLNGNVDNARLLFQALGISVQQFEDALVAAGENGSMSWHEVEVALQGIAEAAKPGLVGIGKFEDAFQQLIDSGGRGKEAIIALKNVAVEAKEAGVKTLEELKAKMMADARFTPEQINALFQALSQRGIKNLDQLAEASSRTGGGIIADMESLGVAFAEVTSQIAKVTEEINKTPDNTEKNIHYTFTSSFDENTQAAKDGGLFDGAGIKAPPEPQNPAVQAKSLSSVSTRALRAPSVLAARVNRLSGEAGTSGTNGGGNFTVVVNAPNSEHGSEMRIRQVVMDMKPHIIRDAASLVQDRSRRRASR
jgi:TP901 family phage tail tape measure protein